MFKKIISGPFFFPGCNFGKHTKKNYKLVSILYLSPFLFLKWKAHQVDLAKIIVFGEKGKLIYLISNLD